MSFAGVAKHFCVLFFIGQQPTSNAILIRYYFTLHSILLEGTLLIMPSCVTYSEQVVEALKTMLLRGELAPGDRVNEAKIAVELGISRAPVREALHMLTTEGLIEIRPQKGKFITKLSQQEVYHSYFVGGVLEGAAAAACCQYFSDSDFTQLEAVLDKMREAVDSGLGTIAMAPLDTSFHQIIFTRVNNPLLEELSRRSCLRISKFLLFRHWQQVYTAHEVYQRHVEVLQELKTRDPQRIEACLRAHYIDSGNRLAPYME